MVIVGRSHDAGVDEAAVQHLFGVVKESHFFSQLLPGPFLPGRIQIRHRRQGEVGAFSLHDAAGMAAAHIADADNPQTNLLLHALILLVSRTSLRIDQEYFLNVP